MRVPILFAALWIVSGTLFADETERLQALIVDGQNNHNWKKTTPVLERILRHSGRFDVDVATAPGGNNLDDFRPDFSKYDVVVSNYNGHPWSAATKKAFVEFVSEGGGFVSVHAADNSFPEWAEYNEMIGVGGWGGRNEKSGPYLRLRDGEFVHDSSPGRGGSHGRQHEFVMDARKPDHPIIQGLPAQWKHGRDELYDRLRGPAKNVTVLASAHSTKETNGSGEHEPLLMTIPYGKGRVFHTALGHGLPAIECVGFQVTLVRGAEWAATGKVTVTDVPHDFPTAERASYRRLPRKPGNDGWVQLFDGKTLDGWTQVNGTAKYTVEDGTVLGTTNEGSPNSFLCTTNLYGDFELELEVLVDDELNSGIQIRSNSFHNHNDGRVHGYQVEIAVNGTAGFIYDEARRGWLSKNRKDPVKNKAFRSGKWNAYRIVCRGDSLKTWVNGVAIADVTDSMTASGFIGLQVHGIGKGAGPYQVRWRNIRLRELGAE